MDELERPVSELEKIRKKSEIIERLNELCTLQEDYGGAIFPEMVLEDREDEGLPPPTESELREIEKTCKENYDIYCKYGDEINKLEHEYEELFDYRPYYNGFMNRYEERLFAKQWRRL